MSHGEIAVRWAEQVGTDTPRYLSSTGQNLFLDGDRVMSFGRHFELGRLIGTRDRGCFLLNGDRYSPSTDRHQSLVRNACGYTDVPVIIIPYAALRIAGIDVDSIRPVEVLPDRSFETYTDVYPPSAFDTSLPACGLGIFSRAEHMTFTDERTNTLDGWYASRTLQNGADNEWSDWTVYKGPWTRANQRKDGTWFTSRREHFLGASLLSASTLNSTRRHKYLSAFDDNEVGSLYYFCQCPRTAATTVADAILALAPRIVHAAITEGRDVQRQGDIFAIPTTLTDGQVFSRSVTRARRSAVVSERGKIHPGESGYRPPSYVVVTDADARAAITEGQSGYQHLLGHPDAKGRLGAMIAARSIHLTASAVDAIYQRSSRTWIVECESYDDYDAARAAIRIHGTGHTATQVVRTRSGVTYGKGVLSHDPQLETSWRNREHANQKLADGDTWFLMVRNTVPRNRDERIIR